VWPTDEPQRSYYAAAAVCRRGHVESDDLSGHVAAARCSECGAPVLQDCPKCSTQIRGYYIVPGVISAQSYNPPAFCHECGAPFPWVDRRGRISTSWPWSGLNSVAVVLPNQVFKFSTGDLESELH
jgi:hypothetical protein